MHGSIFYLRTDPRALGDSFLFYSGGSIVLVLQIAHHPMDWAITALEDVVDRNVYEYQELSESQLSCKLDEGMLHGHQASCAQCL